MVLSIDKTAEKFSLGIKQLSNDPWRAVAEKYAPGTKVKGKVTKVADFGIFLEIEAGVEGLIHVSELDGDGGKPKEQLKTIAEGTEIDCVVTAVDLKEHKLSLSVKAMHKAEERENIRHYAKQSTSSRTSFGDVLNESLAAKLKGSETPKTETDSVETETEPDGDSEA